MKHYLTVILILALSGCTGAKNRNDALNISLHEAAGAGNIEAVQRLIDEGVNVNSKTPEVGETPLFWAAIGCNLMETETPLQKTEPQEIEPCQGGNEIHADIVDLLVANGADVDAKTDLGGGYTPLHAAVLNDSLPVAEALIKAGADVNFETSKGATPLKVANKMQQFHFAASYWQP